MFSNGLPCNLPFPSCLGVPKDSGSDELLPTSMGNREPVILNVYDMVGILCDEVVVTVIFLPIPKWVPNMIR